MRGPLPIRVVGTGVHLPETVVTNQRLTELFDTTDEWIVSRTGIRERRWLEPELAASDMGVAAARPALAAAGCHAADLDAVVVASYTGDQPLPSTALIVADALGAYRALPIDVTQAACASGVQAVLLAAHLVAGGAFETVLVVAAEAAARVTDPADRTTGVFFGDAAAAVVLSRTDAPDAGLLSFDYGSELSYQVQIPAGGSRRPPSAQTVAARQHYLAMDGRAVWDTALTHLPASIAAAAGRADLTMAEVDHFFLHQANLNILTAVADRLGVPMARVPITLDKIGNTGAAGAFTALHEVHAQGRLKPGDRYILAAIGAGFQWGTLCLRHG
jgi:3-oxoacyl-[acyl-carrier-protein] synthase-3